MQTLINILLELGIEQSNGLFYTNDDKWKNEIAFPNRIKKLLNSEQLKPTAFFCFDNKPLILFYLNPSDEKELHKAIWNFNESPIVIIVNNNTTTIYNGFKLEENELLQKIGGEKKLNDFSYFELVTGKTWEKYEKQLNYKYRVDYKLLENIKATRKVLIGNNKSRNSRIVNALIGKIIFIRYLIDRGVRLKYDGDLIVWTNDTFCKLILNDPDELIGFCKYLENREEGFNGDLFPLNEDEYKQLTQADCDLLKNLLKGVDIEKGQPSFFNLYDFSIIPIEFISNVYELFIGNENQKEEGAYYTPLFLVDYILTETVEKKLNSSTSNYNCKVLDPACGSGVFLVETLRKIIEKYISVTGVNVATTKFKTAIKKLVEDNIFGIDKDKSAVQVAIFSIYLTMLDYLKPPQIEDAFKFPNLLNTNFFEGDFFNENLSFNGLKEYEFDFIVGNPPWVGAGMDEVSNKYLIDRKKKEKSLKKNSEIGINNNELVEAFVFRVSDFSKGNPQIALIVRSLALYLLGYKKDYSPFRQYLLQEFYIDKVFELAPVRMEVFNKYNKKAVAPAAILFYRYANGKPTDQNIVEHITLKKSRFFSLFNIFSINHSDYQEVQQSLLKQYDWLWKVLVYGSYLDFNFIKRLKEEYTSIKDLISDESRFVYGTGIQYSSKPVYPSSHLNGKLFVDAYAVNNFSINERKISKFDKDFVHRIRNEKLFEAPVLLMRKGLDMDHLVLKCAVSQFELLYKDSLSGIKTIQEKDKNILYQIGALFASKLTTYFSINTFGNIGIEREQTQNYDKFSLPYLEIDATKAIASIEKNNQLIFDENKKADETGLLDIIKISKAKEKIKEGFAEINKVVIDKIEPTDVEFSLLDYATNINKLEIVGTDVEKQQLYKSIAFQDDYLNQYAQLFIDRFKKKLDTATQKFTIEIWHANQIVGVFCKVVNAKEYKEPIQWINKQDNAAFIKFLFATGQEKITEQLFIQKDIRGFDNNGNDFYIIKPNEQRLWHKAIGYLDVNEFVEAIFNTTKSSN